MYYLGIDVGGTNVVSGVVDENNNIISKAKAKTNVPTTPEQFADDLAGTVFSALGEANITLDDVPWVGIGCPGTVNRATGIIEFANNLYFRDLHLRELMEERLNGKKVILENDANAAAYGEYMAGALKGATNAIAITLGTGLGGGIIINHKIYSGSNFAGAEIGHTVIVTDGKPCTCGRNGCWESYASATGLIKITKEHMQNTPKNSPIWDLVDGDIDKVNGRTAFDAMRAGDALGKSAVDEYIKYLGVGLTNIVNIFQPDIICIGGGVSNEGDALIVPLKEFVDKEQYANTSAKQPVICKAELGNDAGVIGAAFLGVQDEMK